jgi:uncharacterized membrane protein
MPGVHGIRASGDRKVHGNGLLLVAVQAVSEGVEDREIFGEIFWDFFLEIFWKFWGG